MKNVIKLLQALLAIVFVLVIFSFYVDEVSTAPDQAKVFVDHEKKTYYAVPYIQDISGTDRSDIGQLDISTIKEVHDLEYKPDRECTDQGYFMQEGRNILAKTLENIGLLKTLPSRWNKDGSWNW